jgi:hypothetical protein
MRNQKFDVWHWVEAVSLGIFFGAVLIQVVVIICWLLRGFIGTFQIIDGETFVGHVFSI